jgi:cytoskeletal protein CcmA (bactofilin family)
VVGSGARFVGDLFGDGDVLVEGHLEGKIRVSNNVRVGLTGSVEGDVEARGVMVLGRVRGQILASERAELASSATLEGSVQAPKILIAEGAQLDGSVTMSSRDAPKKSEA